MLLSRFGQGTKIVILRRQLVQFCTAFVSFDTFVHLLSSFMSQINLIWFDNVVLPFKNQGVCIPLQKVESSTPNPHTAESVPMVGLYLETTRRCMKPYGQIRSTTISAISYTIWNSVYDRRYRKYWNLSRVCKGAVNFRLQIGGGRSYWLGQFKPSNFGNPLQISPSNFAIFTYF